MKVRAHASSAHQYWIRWVALGWLSIGVLTLGACRRGGTIDTAPRQGMAEGTITGTVRAAAGTSTVDGRTVEAINVDTGARLRVSTNPGGGFSFRLQPGRYRVQVTLRDGESLASQPGIINLDTADIENAADFVVTPVRVSRPRPIYRTDDGLGSPIA